MADLQLVDDVLAACKASGRAAAIATASPMLTLGYMDELGTMAASARQIAAGGWTETVRHGVITTEEKKAARALIAGVRDLQTLAKIEYEDTAPAKLDAFFVGSRLYTSRARLDECTTAILEQVKNEPLPGATPQRISSLVGLLKIYRDVQGTQTSAQSKATAARAELEALMKEINSRRRKLQLAADMLWPPSPDNRGIRREFRLPLDRRLA